LRAYLLLTALCLALFLPGLAAVPPIDRDESRFAQASKQMIESGDYIRIRFQGESRAKKPAGIYWLQTASARLTGAASAIWAYRLPSVAGATLAALLLFGFGRRLAGERAALTAAALLASCFMLVSEAHQAKTDAVQLAAVIAAQGALARLYVERKASLWLALAFWLAQAAGILIKGPIVPMVSLLTVLALSIADRDFSWLRGLRALPGLVLVAAVVGPWAWAISHATQGQFIGQAVKHDLFAKLVGAQESHGAAPGTYLALAMATLWPASLFVPPSLPDAVRRRKEPLQRFLLAWILPNWLLFEAIPTKLPHYILPVYPALLLLAALWLENGAWRRWHWLPAALYGVVGTALAGAVMAAGPALKQPLDWSWAPLAAAILLLGWVPVAALARRLAALAVGSALAAAVIAYGGIFAGLLPGLEPLWIGQRLAREVSASTPLAAAGFHEPSLVFLHGTDTALVDGEGAADFLAQHRDGVAAVEREAEAGFRQRLAADDLTAEAAGEIDGFNYSRGRPARITLWKLKEKAD
jgi:4-amino-4-deoxy-L-arabinose transferase-like glycosyltransferase